jgi:aspartate aminotransferase
MPKLRLSNRARQTPPSPIRRLAHLADKARKEGKGVFHLNIGQPDIASPKEFFDGVREFKDKVLAYERSQGNEILCQAWSDYTNRQLNLRTTPEQYLITMGASEALVFLFMTCCDPGDEVIIFDPTYANYIGFAAIAGVTLIPILSDLEHNFALPSYEQIESHITNRTRAILLCSPNNPTGTVYTREELQCLLSVCEDYNIFLVVDETYREFVYDGLEPFSVLQLAPQSKRVIVVDSLSKRFSLCGARIGCFLTYNEEVLATTLNIAQARLSAPSLDQIAAAHMLKTISDDYLTVVRNEYQARRDTLVSSLQRVPGVDPYKPKGAFYSIVQLPVDDTDKFASFLLSDFSLNNKTVFVAPASGFYMQNTRGKTKVRLAYVIESPQIEEAINILGAGLAAYNKA